MHIIKIIALCSLFAACSCGGSSKANATAENAPAPKASVPFDADSAFSFVAQQVQFGPRVPGSEASRQCASWIVDKLAQYGASDITQQQAQVKAYDGTTLDINNITASFNPQAQKRLLLVAHWDSRPWADQDPSAALREKPIDGANDGASGVGVILEIARNMAAQSPRVGVDILLADAEDYGRRSDAPYMAHDENTWCLGTQHWVENPTLDVTKIRYALLLDMVGAKDAVFHREYFSQGAAPSVVDKVWRQAANSGFGQRFPEAIGGAVVDDHLYLIKAGIPAIDIIESMHPDTETFNPTWHTHADNIDNIDPLTLKAVGQTVQDLIYNE